LRFRIASLIAEWAPSTSVAWKLEPYSTKRSSPRRNQVRLGMNEPTGCWPVAIADRQTGVRDGKDEAQGACRVPR
jgi:hypothetical protein